MSTAENPAVEPLAATAFALPPILLRNTYPPGQPEIGAPPTPLGHVPQGIDEIMFPGTQQGTLFQGPVVSGPAPGINGACGAARLTLSLQVDFTMGNFQLPIQFPGGSFITALNAITLQAGLATTFIMIGTEAGQGDIATVPLPALGAFEPDIEPSVQLPLWNAAAPQAPFTAWVSVSANTGQTAGCAIVLIDYVRIPAPWSTPATNYNRP